MSVKERAEAQGYQRARCVDLDDEIGFSTEGLCPDLELWARVNFDPLFLKVLATDDGGVDHFITRVGTFTVWWELEGQDESGGEDDRI